jgi:tetratricopeptide (TPR) repeat protein
MRSRLKVISSTFVCTTVAMSALAADDLLAQGKRFYQNGNYEKAGQCLQAQVKQHPKDAVAHYILGNVFVALKRNADAEKEYKTASSLDPKGSVGQYSTVALTNLAHHAYDNVGSAASSSQRAADNDPVSSLIRDTSTPEKRSTTYRRTVPDNDSEQQRLIGERESKIAEIRRDADRKIGQLQSELQGKIDGNGRALRARGRYYYDPADANDEVKKEYQPQINSIKDDAEKRIQAVKDLYARKLSH